MTNNLSLSYRQARILSHVCGGMYYGGPTYRFAKKDMTRREKLTFLSFLYDKLDYDYLHQRLRMQHPDLLGDKTDEEVDLETWRKAEDVIIDIPITPRQFNLCIRAFATTFEESIIDNYRDLEIITGFPIAEIRQVYEKMLQTRSEMESL